jgi:hypothetical protein
MQRERKARLALLAESPRQINSTVGRPVIVVPEVHYHDRFSLIFDVNRYEISAKVGQSVI